MVPLNRGSTPPPSQPAITQTKVGFLFQQAEPIEVLILDQLFRDRIERKILDVVGQRAAKQKLDREIVNPFGILAVVGLLGTYPPLREDIAYRSGDGLEMLTQTDSVGSQGISKLTAQYGCGPINFTGAEEALYEGHLLFELPYLSLLPNSSFVPESSRASVHPSPKDP
jgi:hypothetical protein